VTDTYHGVAVVDPYQWLESSDPAVAEWSTAQNAYARSKLDAFPERAPIRARIAELLESQSADYFDLAERRGVVFALELHPPKQQRFLVTLPLASVVGGKRLRPTAARRRCCNVRAGNSGGD